MKTKTLTTLFLLCIIQTGLSQLTFVPDDNFEQALIDLGYDSGPLDDYVLTANIDTVLSLNVSAENIQNLTGIEGFSSLEALICNNNQLTNLDVSLNTMLLALWCGNNQLTSLDVSQNTSLTSLVISFNDITNIDVSLNIALTGLFSLGTQLNTLDVSNNPSLEFLYCQNNFITDLDLSQNVFLQGLHIDNNQLIELDVSQSLELHDIQCSNNQLTHLDLRNGNNSNVTNDDFNSLNNPNLTCIFVDDAAYSTANWSDIDPTNTFVETEAACNALSVSHFDESLFRIYPNPADNELFIRATEPFKKATVYSMQGQKVLENTSESIDVSKLNAGIYILFIEGMSGQGAVIHFIKK